MTSSRVEKFLAGAVPPAHGNLIFALDATASRERTWDTAAELQAEMFRSVALVGALEVQLVYFRGLRGVDAACKASPWISDAAALGRLMARIRCATGTTQIGRVLSHCVHEAALRKIDALVYVGDCCEERRDQLEGPANELARLGVPTFLLQEGSDPVAAQRFERIAALTGGAVVGFNAEGVAELASLLRAIATFAVGGRVALEQHGSSAARLLLERMRK